MRIFAVCVRFLDDIVCIYHHTILDRWMVNAIVHYMDGRRPGQPLEEPGCRVVSLLSVPYGTGKICIYIDVCMRMS